MYKIKYLPTGHVFLLPEAVAMELKNKNPFDYQILEKDGKKIIYEDNGQMHLAPSQTELAEEFINSGEDKAKFSEIFGGFFGRSKSMFNNKKDDNLI